MATATRQLLRPYQARIIRVEPVARIHVSTPGGDITAAVAVAATYEKHLRLLSGGLPTEPGDVLVPAEMARSAGLRAGESIVVVHNSPDGFRCCSACSSRRRRRVSEVLRLDGE